MTWWLLALPVGALGLFLAAARRGSRSDREQTAAAQTRAEHGAHIAYQIRAELVCCHLYERVNGPEGLTFEEAQAGRSWHDICYWGEAAARIAENPIPEYAKED